MRLQGLTLPAFANAHSHAFQRAIRGRTQTGRGDFWTWRELMYATANRLDPDNYFELAKATYGEMAEAGIGSVGEFHYVHHQPGGQPYARANAMGEALLAAAEEVGIRITLLDTLYLWGGLGEGSGGYLELSAAQRRFGDSSAESWAERVDELVDSHDATRSRIGAAVHSVRAVDPASVTTVADWARNRGAPLHLHVSEQPAENAASLEYHGCTPIQLLDSVGALGPSSTLVHATHVTPADIDLVAANDTGCCLCPTTERDLADGTTPSEKLAKADIAISLGSDSQAVIDPLAEAMAIEMNQRLTTLERGVHSTDELLSMATCNGSRALGWNGGAISKGYLADFTTVGLDSSRLAGSLTDDAPAAVVFGATAADVRHLIVGGRHLVRDGKHVSFSVAEALKKAISTVGSP